MSRRLREQADELIVHTGQHYDDELSRVFFEELSVPAPDRELDAGGGTNTAQTARILGALEPVLAELEPAAGAGLRRHQLHARRARWRRRRRGIRLAHVEAGMRSFDRSMPEELNRVLTDHASELLLCSTETAMRNLEREGVARRGASGGRRDGGRVACLPRHRGGALAVLAARARAGRLPRGDRAPGRERGPPGAAAGAGGVLGRCPRRWCFRCIRARASGSRRRG